MAEGDITKTVSGFMKELGKLARGAIAAFLIFVLFIFVVGELYALYMVRLNNSTALWGPVILLMAILFVKAVE